MEASNYEPNLKLGNMVRKARLALGMTQQQLGAAMGKSRHWVGQLERGEWYERSVFTLDGDTAVRLAVTLNLPPAEVLHAGRVPKDRWPDLSKIRSVNARVKFVDITTLTPHQQDIIESLVDEFKYPSSTESE